MTTMTTEPASEPAQPPGCNFCKSPRIYCDIVFTNPTEDTTICGNCVVLMTNKLYQLNQLANMSKRVKH